MKIIADGLAEYITERISPDYKVSVLNWTLVVWGIDSPQPSYGVRVFKPNTSGPSWIIITCYSDRYEISLTINTGDIYRQTAYCIEDPQFIIDLDEALINHE